MTKQLELSVPRDGDCHLILFQLAYDTEFKYRLQSGINFNTIPALFAHANCNYRKSLPQDW